MVMVRHSRIGSDLDYEQLQNLFQSTLEGLMIYARGELIHQGDTETYYFLISSKKAI